MAKSLERSLLARLASAGAIVSVIGAGLGIAVLAQAQDNPNAFNRLLKRSVTPNAAPPQDGIHDPTNPGTGVLQPPSESFSVLPPAQAGNRIDWVRALDDGQIQPWADLSDPSAEKDVMDLDIVMEVKGTMPDVVYPHKQHTEWLDCANCHTELFIPQRGKNQLSMAAILLGEQCGVCHGKVAFPVSDCKRCHSRPKSPASSGEASGEASDEDVVAAVTEQAEGAEPPSFDQLMAAGEILYFDHCSACHGEQGEGFEDFPAMVGSAVVQGPLDDHLQIVLAGVADTAMMAWGEEFGDGEIAAIMTFERNAWGNGDGESVTAEQIAEARTRLASGE
ncbi:MAG: c-type cytochrome [Alphaproteobacteria bacterium]|nr:c-type cytochrome [Alphaproteobacteria bacterium]